MVGSRFQGTGATGVLDALRNDASRIVNQAPERARQIFDRGAERIREERERMPRNASTGQQALAAVGRGFQWVTLAEQALTSPLAAIPTPGLPALTVTQRGLGLPHAHMHPPNLIPPAPPIPLPAMLMVMPIPILSGATNTNFEKLPAARCGDLALGAWCGGFFPLAEIFLGSASVWVEMMRAGRMGPDMTIDCIFAKTPRPMDPPLGPMIGFPLTGTFSVQIGGLPLPSLSSFAIGKALGAFFRAVGFLGRITASCARGVLARIVARRAAQRALNRSGSGFGRISNALGSVGIHLRPSSAAALRFAREWVDHASVVVLGDGQFREALIADIARQAQHADGLAHLMDMQTSGHFATYVDGSLCTHADGRIRSGDDFRRLLDQEASRNPSLQRAFAEDPDFHYDLRESVARTPQRYQAHGGAHMVAVNDAAARPLTQASADGAYRARSGRLAGSDFNITGRGRGSSAVVAYDPLRRGHPNFVPPTGASSHRILAHENGHVHRAQHGMYMSDWVPREGQVRRPDGSFDRWDSAWERRNHDAEERAVMHEYENPHAAHHGEFARTGYHAEPIPERARNTLGGSP